MNALRETLITLQSLLEELQPVLSEELKQLNRLQLNPVTLQMLSDNKSRLLSTISYYEAQRKKQESERNVAAPYTHQPLLGPLWQNILTSARLNSELNAALCPILELQMQKAMTLKSMVKQVSHSAAIYNADGKASQHITGKACNITI